jgi:hypothetical protein
MDDELPPAEAPDVTHAEWSDRDSDFETLFDRSFPTIGH